MKTRYEGRTMKAWWVHEPAPLVDGATGRGPLVFGERADPEPGPHEIRVRVSCCGVCRTDLHLAEGDLPVHRPDTIPGHEVVGIVDRLGDGASRFALGARVGIPWLRHTCGVCRFCRRGAENLCIDPRFTGWDADGGFAERAVIDEDFAYALPDEFDDDEAAPLLCAGIIGYRAWHRAELPRRGRLGIYGYGASAHLAAQVALHEGAQVHVLTRSHAARRLALDLGAASAGDAYDEPPVALDAAILFAPVGDLVPVALRALDRGGTLAIAGIHLTDIPPLHYETELFEERQVRSVSANTRRDGEEFLALAARIPIRPVVTRYPFTAVAEALADVAFDRLTGAAVIDGGD
jgi:propanol-preferring alcohol dehydrogenase